tara:strand:- start:86 stop:898 length:813 start_codon:yes stop_codon:yes gene_type:complete
MKIGLTGSKGVLGSTLIKFLNKQKLNFFKGRIEKIKEVQMWIKKNDFDAIIHLAAMVPTYLVNDNKKKALKVNYNGTKNIVDTINRYSQKKIWFFYSSTSHVYKFDNKMINENSKTKPISYYGETKLLGEKYLLKNTKKIIPCIGRIFSFTAKKQDKKYIIPSILEKLRSKNKIIYIDNINHIRDFLPIKDVCRAIKVLSTKSAKGVFNICSSKKLNIKEILFGLNKRYKKKIILTKNNKTTLYGCNKKLKKIGWKNSNIKYINYLLNNF